MKLWEVVSSIWSSWGGARWWKGLWRCSAKFFVILCSRLPLRMFNCLPFWRAGLLLVWIVVVIVGIFELVRLIGLGLLWFDAELMGIRHLWRGKWLMLWEGIIARILERCFPWKELRLSSVFLFVFNFGNHFQYTHLKFENFAIVELV